MKWLAYFVLISICSSYSSTSFCINTSNLNNLINNKSLENILRTFFFSVSTDAAIGCSTTSRPRTMQVLTHEAGGKWDSIHTVSVCNLHSTAPKTWSVLLLIKGFALFHFQYSTMHSTLFSNSWKHLRDKKKLYATIKRWTEVREGNVLKCYNGIQGDAVQCPFKIQELIFKFPHILWVFERYQDKM